MLALWFALGLLVATGCGDCNDSTQSGGGEPGEDAAGADSGSQKDGGTGVGPGPDSGADASDPGPGAPDGEGEGDTNQPPVCAEENQCAGDCCETGEHCLHDQCVEPGDACEHNLECVEGQICEPTIGRCIPDPGVACIYKPETDIFDPEVTVAWSEPPQDEIDQDPDKVFNQVMMTPSVIDLDEDGIPDIIFSTFANNDYNGRGILRAINGKTYEPLFHFTEMEKAVSAASSIAVGDIDGDGRVEIIAAAWSEEKGQREIIAFDDYTTGFEVLWRTDENLSISSGGVSIADLAADGNVQVYGSNWVLDAKTGELLCRGDVDGGGVNSVAADLTGDGKMEVIAPGGAFKFEPDEDKICPKLWSFEGGKGGEPAVGDFGTFTDGKSDFGDLDGIPEVVTVTTAASNQVRLHNGQTGELIWARDVPTSSGDAPGTETPYTEEQCNAKTGAGAPTIADFDGDGVPEIGAAGACFYAVWEANGDLKWRSPVRDFSSRTTGSSVFDFQGDGKAEVVYADECFVRVYDGTGNGDGSTEILFERPHTSGTLRELPVIVDVDNDFHADIVAISNDYNSGITRGCAAEWPAFGDESSAEHGILVLTDSQNRWVSTRPVWNQHTYHVTNICDGLPSSVCPGRPNTLGAIPIGELDNWTQPGLNNYRQNVQGEGLFDAPDLTISKIEAECGSAEGVRLQVTIANIGARGIPEGTDVSVYVTIEGTEHFVTTLQTTQRLLPGGTETVEYLWADAPDTGGQTIGVRAVADADEDGDGQHFECNEDNNELEVEATCRCVSDDDCEGIQICVVPGICIDPAG